MCALFQTQIYTHSKSTRHVLIREIACSHAVHIRRHNSARLPHGKTSSVRKGSDLECAYPGGFRLLSGKVFCLFAMDFQTGNKTGESELSILLFHTDSYLREFAATVSAIDAAERAVALDRTAFYPGGGGQPHDTGVLIFKQAPLRVVKVQKRGDEVWHFLDAALPPAGSVVKGEVDWERRYQLMRTHTAMHILCGVVWRDYAAQVTGGNMEPLQGRMDFEFERMSGELVWEIEEKVNREVQNQREVIVKILPREKAFQIPDLIRTKINLLPENIQQIRIVEIKGLDVQADGGTHVANTKEVGHIHISGYKSKGKINKRIYIQLS